MVLDIVFMGTPEFARASLDALLASGHRVLAVVSQPDRPAGRGQLAKSPPVAARAKELGLPLLQTEATNTVAFRRWVASFSPDLGVVAAFGHILGKKALAVPRLGCVNVHASLLPRWRGASPIQMAVLHGDHLAGISLMQMDEGMDTGPVYDTASLELAPDETGQSLHDRLAVLGGELLVKTLPAIAAGATPTPQPTDGVTLAPLIGKDDGDIDWSQDAVAIERRVRAFAPWPGTFTVALDGPLDGKLLRILPGAEVVDPETENEAPGRVLEAKKGRFLVACGRGALRLQAVQLEGKKVLDAQSFLAGVPALEGMRWGRRSSRT